MGAVVDHVDEEETDAIPTETMQELVFGDRGEDMAGRRNPGDINDRPGRTE